MSKLLARGGWGWKGTKFGSIKHLAEIKLILLVDPLFFRLVSNVFINIHDNTN